MSNGNFDLLNKGQLREAMRNAGLSYSGLNVVAMREALVVHANVGEDLPHELDGTEPLSAEDAALLQEVDAAVDEIMQEDPAVVVQETRTVVAEGTDLAIVAPVAPGTRATSKGIKIQKDRPMQNGVKQPSAGSACRLVWDWLDSEVAAGRVPTVKSAKSDYAEKNGTNPNNASIEFYNWRKFNGIVGRTPKVAASE